MALEDDVAECCGYRPAGWVYVPGCDGFNAVLYFKYRGSLSYSDTEPKDDPPIPFDALQKIDDEYDVESIESNSDGRTGSALAVNIVDP